jgi:hypothetical protein
MALEDYFKGSSQAYGEIAGSLLAGRRKEDRKEAQRALLASVVMNSFGALQNQQKQSIIDGVNDVNTKYKEIFNLNKSEFEAYDDERALLKKYNNPQTRETFLNEEVAKIINNTDEATAARVTWENIDNEPDENLRKKMYAAHNAEKQKLIDRMEALKLDPRATTKTFEQFNQRATEEYKAALALVEDDPTKKGLIRAAWNRIFKRQEDPERLAKLQEAGIDVRGDLVTTNAELIELQDALIKAKENRTTFRDLQDRKIVKRSLVNPLVFKDKDVDMAKIYSEVGNKLANVASGYERYAGTDRRFIDKVIDTVVAEDANLSEQEIFSRGLNLIKNGNIDVKGYLTREENKKATGRLLIETFTKQTEEERIDAFRNKPELVYQVADAYNNAGDRAMAGNILETYKDVNPDYESYEPNANTITNRVGFIEERIKNDPSRDILLLQDRGYLGNLGNRVAQTEHLFKFNNPDWSNEFTEPEITDAAITFVLSRDDVGDPTNVRMTKAHMLPYKKNITEEYVLDILPEITEDLKKTYRNVKDRAEEFTSFRDGFISLIQQRAELNEDEMLNITNIVDKMLENETLDSYQNSVTLQSNITDQLGDKGLVDYHVARRSLSLNDGVLSNAIDNIDLESLSNEELKYLYPKKGYVTGSLEDENIIKLLGLDSRINIGYKEVNKLRGKIGKILEDRVPASPRRDRSDLQYFLDSSTVKPVVPNNKFIVDFKLALLNQEGTGFPTKGYKRYLEKFGG